jgi:hypothetical protein
VTQPTPRRASAYVHEIPAFLAALEEICNTYRIGFEATRARMVTMRHGDRQVCTLEAGPSVRWSLTDEDPSTQETV